MNSEVAAARRYSFFKRFYVWYVQNPVLIYTMGKVGSSSIAVSLRAIGIPEVQPHSLRFSQQGSYFVCPEKNVFNIAFEFVKTCLLRLKSWLWIRTRGSRKIKIVTLVREPISRNISAFFEQFHYISDEDIENIDTDELIRLFWRFCRHDSPIVWYDEEIKALFGVDVYDYTFDIEQGYSIIKQGDVEIFVARLESINSLEQELSQFVDSELFKILPANRGSMKSYRNKYNDFIRKINFSEQYLSDLLDSKYYEHFYSIDEKKLVLNKWTTPENHHH